MILRQKVSDKTHRGSDLSLESELGGIVLHTFERLCFLEHICVQVELERDPHVRELTNRVQRLGRNVAAHDYSRSTGGHEQSLSRRTDALLITRLHYSHRLHEEALGGV